MLRMLTVALIVLTSSARAHEWEVRYAQLADQTPEWTAMGRVPGWSIDISADGSTIEIDGDEGPYRGIVLIGRPWTVPDARAVEISLEYQTFCAISTEEMKRSGTVQLMAFTRDRWDALATEPAKAVDLALAPKPLCQKGIHAQGDDVTEWLPCMQEARLGALGGMAGQEVILAIVWSAYHFEPEWAKFRNLEVRPTPPRDLETEFLQQLDLDRPELVAVKDALGRGDRDAAKAALVAYMRTREQPSLPPLPTDAPESVIRSADGTLSHTFTLVGCPPTTIGEQIRWNEDPHNYDQWAIALNRHYHWLALGRAYSATGDEKYAAEFAAQVRSWVEAMPVQIGSTYIEGPYVEPGLSNLSLDAGIRMAQTWWQAYAYFKDSPGFDVDTQMLMLRSFWEHAVYLMDERVWHPKSNWGAMEVNGLFTLAVMMPEMRDSRLWLDTARQRLVEALAAQVYPDGAQMELAPGYHGVTLNNVVGTLELARRNSVDLPPDFAAGLEMMYEYYVAISTPHGRTPAVNDSGWGGVAGALRKGAELFPQRQDFLYVASAGAEGTPPEKISWSLPYAGWHMMRTGWTPADKYLFFEAGPYGAAHQHEDQLNLLLHAGGKTLLTEGGVYSYDRSEWRRYVLSSRAHNVVHVDGLEQQRRGLRETMTTADPYESRWSSDADFDYAQGTYSSGFGPERQLRVTHTRRVLFVKPDYWIVIDSFTPEDDRQHTYEALFHLDADDAVVDDQTRAASVVVGDTGLRIIPIAAALPEVEIIKGQIEPVVQGWLPTGRHNELRPIPTAVFRWAATGPLTVAYALAPREEAQWPVRACECLPGSTATSIVSEIALTTGGRDLLAVGEAGAGRELPGLGETDAEMTLTRIGDDGSVRSRFDLR
ncbi:MAG TPA: hypothetical protein DGT21_07405 [Armatimonadetes bacterium]|nr:hypothetical protein [Armatimonadota bacterium]